MGEGSALMSYYDVQLGTGSVDIYSPETVGEWGPCYPGDTSEFRTWSNQDKKAILTIAYRDQGQGNRVHDDPGFAVNALYYSMLGQCAQAGEDFEEFYDSLLAGLPSGYIDMIVENRFPKYMEERGL